jgi:ligand-binding sensor domain-containing protein/signal transduction histidine kinase
MSRTLLFSILISAQVCFSYGQGQSPYTSILPQPTVDNWQMEQGLPVNSIVTAAQTADGWIYFGTEEGLVRFDGNSFLLRNKTNIPGLNVNFVSALCGASDTSLWIGTEGGGLFRYKNNAYVKYSKSSGLSDDRIFTLCEDAGGGLWIGTSGKGLNYLKNGKITRIDTLNGLASNYVRSIAIDAKGGIWVGTQKGLSLIDNGKIKSYFRKDGISDDFIETLAIDKEQNVWIGTKSGGLNVFRKGRFEVYTVRNGLTDNSVTTLCFDRNGMLWIGTNGGGIIRMLNGKLYPFTSKEGLRGDLIVSLIEDREGNIWVGSSGTGIDRIKKKSIQTLTSREGLPGDVILPVLEDHEGILWMGVAGKGLHMSNHGKERIFTQKDGIPDHLVLAIAEDLDHTLWIGTAGGGLSRYKNERFTTYTIEDGLSNNVVTTIHSDRSGTLWAGTTGGGLNRFKNGKFSALTTRDGLSDDNVTCILEDKKGNLWVGTNGGLNRIRDQKIDVLYRKNGLSDDYILTLYEDPDGNLWVGTASGGINLVRDNKINSFTTKDGLINDVVLKILEDDYGFFWISCNKGLYKIKKQNLLDYADLKLKLLNPVSYGKSDGMETLECNGGVSPAGFKTRDGKLLFPTMKGISIIDPDRMKTASSYFSPIFIVEFLVDNEPVNMTSPVSVLSYSKRLEFRYAALNYTNPGKIIYRCMLVGFDKTWIENGTDRTAEYTNIPGGHYTFRVMAANESGQWDERHVAEFTFHLKPPFYRSFVFYVIVISFFLLLIFFVFYYFIERIQGKRLKILVAERTKELNQKMIAQEQTQQELKQTNAALLKEKEHAESGDRLKTAFMNNISHEIRTPLNGIIGFGHLMADPELTQDERANYYSIVKLSSDRLLNTVTDFMDISLIASGNQETLRKPFILGDLLNEVYSKYTPYAQAKKLAFTIDNPVNLNTLQVNSDRTLIFKALCHLIDNAIKFTKQGYVSYGTNMRGADLEFFVKDTGIGIHTEVYETMFDSFTQENPSDTRGHEGSGLGLSIVKGIVELLGGRVWYASSSGEGSTFFFTIAIGAVDRLLTVQPETPVRG